MGFTARMYRREAGKAAGCGHHGRPMGEPWYTLSACQAAADEGTLPSPSRGTPLHREAAFGQKPYRRQPIKSRRYLEDEESTSLDGSFRRNLPSHTLSNAAPRFPPEFDWLMVPAIPSLPKLKSSSLASVFFQRATLQPRVSIALFCPNLRIA